ncbi:Peptidyl-prolyl cis-trans isomerase fkbp8 [Parelaphostrongylus tenuis]|uniref:peptidylprolyl isomerase n=1 Tax=Parelaphostrongylus tenuis TaxID=148309 RepID=A0AAD5WK12_PARTN|nr:Peptidyl-prolyl cis-trans isomerase fkbp8 [Parelaphostrongylus tenuis]
MNVTDSHCLQDVDVVEHDDLVEVLSPSQRAVSSGEQSLDGSIDEERGALSDSDVNCVARSHTLASQVKGPSSDALEESCRMEAVAREKGSEWEDLLGSGHLMKRVVRDGHGDERPSDGQWVTIKVVDTLRGIDSHDRLTFILGFSMVIDAWELTIKLMCVEEVAEIRVRSRLAYGECGLDDIIPPDQDQEYRIELLEIGSSPNYSAMEEGELSDFVLMLKDRGNFYFNRREYEKAIFVYKRASGIIEVPKDSEALSKLFSALHSNLAVCYAKLEDWNEVLKCTEESLRLHAANTKALFRRAAALAARNDTEEAMRCLLQAREIDPHDTVVQCEIERLCGIRKRRRAEERALYRRMLIGAGDVNTSSRSFDFVTYRLIAIGVFSLVTFTLFVFFLYQLWNSPGDQEL